MTNVRNPTELSNADRLHAADLKKLLTQLKNDYAEKNLIVAQGNIKLSTDTIGYAAEEGVDYFTIVKEYKSQQEEKALEKDVSITKRFTIFDLTKDDDSPKVEPGLFNIKDIITHYCQTDAAKGILLFPLLECQGVLGVSAEMFEETKKHYPILESVSHQLGITGELFDYARRFHAILIEVDLDAKKIISHDSRSKWRSYAYPDIFYKFAVTMQFAYEPRFYNTQADNILCGLYVFNYIRLLLEQGNTNSFNTFLVSQAMDEAKNQPAEKWQVFPARFSSWMWNPSFEEVPAMEGLNKDEAWLKVSDPDSDFADAVTEEFEKAEEQEESVKSAKP